MNLNDPVGSVLARKGTEVAALPPYAYVADALREMADRDIGAMLVLQSGRPVGMFSERDYARKVLLMGRTSGETKVREVMSPALCVSPKDTVEGCLHLMTSARVRHVAVIEDNEVTGVISVGDLVNWIISAQAETIDHLSQYIAIGYPG